MELWALSGPPAGGSCFGFTTGEGATATKPQASDFYFHTQPHHPISAPPKQANTTDTNPQRNTTPPLFGKSHIVLCDMPPSHMMSSFFNPPLHRKSRLRLPSGTRSLLSVWSCEMLLGCNWQRLAAELRVCIVICAAWDRLLACWAW